MRGLDGAILVLLIIGGLNWGLIALFNFDLVAALFGGDVGYKSTLSRVVYGLVGLAALYCITLIGRVSAVPFVVQDRTPRI